MIELNICPICGHTTRTMYVGRKENEIVLHNECEHCGHRNEVTIEVKETENATKRRQLETIAEICGMISKRSALEQTAEEAAELGQACLKLCRKISFDNPTPCSVDELMHNLNEEIADVFLCSAVLAGLKNIDPISVEAYIKYKALHWRDRLREAHEARETCKQQ